MVSIDVSMHNTARPLPQGEALSSTQKAHESHEAYLHNRTNHQLDVLQNCVVQNNLIQV